MNRRQFFTFILLILTAVVSGSAEAIDYAVSFTDSSFRLGYFVLKSNGTSFQTLPPVFVTSNAPIGTTTLYKLNNDVLVHHTFRAANGTPTYGVAVFDFQASRLKQLLSAQSVKVAQFHPLRVYGTRPGTPQSPMGSPPRTMYMKTQNDTASALLNANGTPAGGKKIIFNNPAASDILYAADLSKDGNWAVQSISRFQGFVRVNQLQIRRISNGGGMGPVSVMPTGIAVYSPSLSGPVTIPSGPNEKANAGFRWLGYRLFLDPATPNQRSAVGIIKIDDLTGKHIGVGKPVADLAPSVGNAQSFPSIVVAPDGNFVIYTAYSNTCKKQILLLQKISPQTGNKIGGKKTLIGCNKLTNIPIGFYGIDMIRIN